MQASQVWGNLVVDFDEKSGEVTCAFKNHWPGDRGRCTPDSPAARGPKREDITTLVADAVIPMT